MAKGTSIAPVASTASPPADPTSSRIQRKTRAFGTPRNNTKLGRIAPAGPTAKQLNLESQRILGRGQIGALSFGQAYGVLGVPMLCILLVCIAWTSWLIFLALAPNTAANLLMDTSSYDNGEFWLITDINPHMTIAGAVGLVVVDVCYLIVTLRMLFWRDKLFGSAFSGHPSTFTTSRRGRVSWLNPFIPRYRLFRNLYEDLTAYEGKNRKKWVCIMSKLLVYGGLMICLFQYVECISEACRHCHGDSNATPATSKRKPNGSHVWICGISSRQRSFLRHQCANRSLLSIN